VSPAALAPDAKETIGHRRQGFQRRTIFTQREVVRSTEAALRRAKRSGDVGTSVLKAIDLEILSADNPVDPVEALRLVDGRA
jgi:hypothetical protein